MATYPVNKLRNVCVMGHGGDGKTSLIESLLFTSGATERVGKVPEGNTVCDYDPEEVKRQFSISTAVAPVAWEDWAKSICWIPRASLILKARSSMRCAWRSLR